MKSLFNKMDVLSKHISLLDKTFRSQRNYGSLIDFEIYRENASILNTLVDTEKLKNGVIKSKKFPNGNKIDSSFSDEIYSENDRQMKLADIIEYILYSRGVYYLFQGNQFRKERVQKFIEINLRIVNLLMIYESLTVDKKLRDAFLGHLQGIIGHEDGYNDLVQWKNEVGLNEKNPKYDTNAPNDYFDSLLPKTAGGLWHEILVYCFILKYNIGYIFPLLLAQKPISLNHKLSPPDLVILHRKTYRYYGIEIGALKERQSGGFMAPSGMPIIPIDTLNARTSDRCPSCSKWIGLCPKVIKDFSNTDLKNGDGEVVNEIRCLTECDIYTLDEQLDGKCKYMKFKYKNANWKYKFVDNSHHHYHCCLTLDPNVKTQILSIKSLDDLKALSLLRTNKNDLTSEELAEKKRLQSNLTSRYSFIKTHSIFYSELTTLLKMNLDDVKIEEE